MEDLIGQALREWRELNGRLNLPAPLLQIGDYSRELQRWNQERADVMRELNAWRERWMPAHPPHTYVSLYFEIEQRLGELRDELPSERGPINSATGAKHEAADWAARARELDIAGIPAAPIGKFSLADFLGWLDQLMTALREHSRRQGADHDNAKPVPLPAPPTASPPADKSKRRRQKPEAHIAAIGPFFEAWTGSEAPSLEDFAHHRQIDAQQARRLYRDQPTFSQFWDARLNDFVNPKPSAPRPLNRTQRLDGDRMRQHSEEENG